MQISVETVIAADRIHVWQVFENPRYLTHWQPTLKSRQLRNGIDGQPGSVARLTYVDNGRETVVSETITERRAPTLKCASYDCRVVNYTIENVFSPLENGSTRWRVNADFHFRGLTRKLLCRCLRGTIAKRLIGDMNRLKSLVENGLQTDIAA